jgi:hypothetical protein
MKFLLLLVFLLVMTTEYSVAQKYYTPKTGSAERKEIMDALRPVMENYLGVPVKFVIDELRVLRTADGSYCWVTFEPQNPKTNKIYTIEETAQKENADQFDSGMKTYAIMSWHKKDKCWYVQQYVTAPTDVAWGCWWKEYNFPKELFPYTENECTPVE